MNIFYTAINPETKEETKIEFDFKEEQSYQPGIKVQIKDDWEKYTTIVLDSQQAAELGHLLVALSGHHYDVDSVHELIEGYECGLVSVV